MAEPDALAREHYRMTHALEKRRRRDRTLLLQTITEMRGSVATPTRWRARTTCITTPLSEGQLAASFAALADYWRKPQPFVDAPDLPGLGAAVSVLASGSC